MKLRSTSNYRLLFLLRERLKLLFGLDVSLVLLSVFVGIIVMHIADLALYDAVRCCCKLCDELNVRVVLLLFVLILLDLVIRTLLNHSHSSLRLI